MFYSHVSLRQIPHFLLCSINLGQTQGCTQYVRDLSEPMLVTKRVAATQDHSEYSPAVSHSLDNCQPNAEETRRIFV